ncbi:Mutant cadherin [Operophtera brumata]|uniref:Mutant cadherin n=1 Tax=Operophtera brumata TaxID=104452 RepID=A0A0L7LKW0_OPEBR|nr:Mutant cadherin [Operophtera brumata]
MELEEVKTMLRELRSCAELSSGRQTCSMPSEKKSEKYQEHEENTITSAPVPLISCASNRDSNHTNEQKKRNNRQIAGTSLKRTHRRSRSRSPGSRPDNTNELPPPLYRDMIVSAGVGSLQATYDRAPHEPRNNESFILVERKKRKRLSNYNGTAQRSNKLQVAEVTSAVYVSRLNKSTTVDDIREYIREMGQECKNIDFLTQKKETDFNSFKVTVPRYNIGVFLNEGFWPQGVKFRLYREYTVRKDE